MKRGYVNRLRLRSLALAVAMVGVTAIMRRDPDCSLVILAVVVPFPGMVVPGQRSLTGSIGGWLLERFMTEV